MLCLVALASEAPPHKFLDDGTSTGRVKIPLKAVEGASRPFVAILMYGLEKLLELW